MPTDDNPAAVQTPLLRSSDPDYQTKAENLSRDNPYDRSPVNIAFTHRGLFELKVAGETLESFPEPFKEGMASRAELLGDTEVSAPGYWDGQLGQASVHGVLTGGFAAKGASAAAWAALHRQVAAFNRAGPGEGAQLRRALDLLFLLGGVQILHIELGQDPYRIGSDGKPEFPAHRTEHFGFRDGIGQPFRDLDLGPSTIGNGVLENGVWRNLAAGEIYLGHEDEDSSKSPLPTNNDLRNNGTYLVFRKLEQDVAGFHSFAGERYPNEEKAQAKLKAQIVGRWPNGADLVRNPNDEPAVVDEATISQFHFRPHDADGNACPLGAHVRRVNPRDIGDIEVRQPNGSRAVDAFVRRHRIQRRSIGYGGAFYGADPSTDSVPRGLLFSAYNARIDIQFEVIQSRWINQGEFLGQAGLNRDALVGANRGRPKDQFQEPGKPAPVPQMPAFVTTRGGDYFFVPSLTALRGLARGDTFESGKQPVPGKGFKAPLQPGLFSETSVFTYTKRILEGIVRTVRVNPEAKSTESDLPPSPHGPPEADAKLPVVFVARHADVTRVLNSEKDTPFTVKRYGRVSQKQTGGKILLALQDVGADSADRLRLSKMLHDAWTNMGTGNQSGLNRITAIFDAQVASAVSTAQTSGRIDLVHELMTQGAYNVVTDVFGVTGPQNLANVFGLVSLPESQIEALHLDWQQAFETGTGHPAGLASMVAWASASLLDLVLNVNEHGEVAELGTYAGQEYAHHLRQAIAASSLPAAGTAPTLLQALMALAPAPDNEAHRKDVMLILIELIGSMLSILPLTFGRLMHTLLSNGINLPLLVPALDAITHGPNGPIPPNHAVERLIYETLRINPSPVPLFRHVGKAGAELPGGERIEGPCWVAALSGGAGFDQTVFPQPREFSLHPVIPGPERPIANYLPFGPSQGEKFCWGQRLAMTAMVRGVRAASRLSGLGRVAGPTGEPLDLLKITIGLQAKCARV